MSGTLTLAIRGWEYEFQLGSLLNLQDAIGKAQAGRDVLYRLDPDAKTPKPSTKASFRFLTKRGAERLSKADQRELLKLCEQVLAGEDHYWPPKFSTFVTVTSE
jgi:hypothetical protein